MTRKLTHDEITQRRQRLETINSVQRLPLIVLLDNVRSLYNVGSIFRTSDGAMIEKLYLCGFTPHPPRKEIEKTALGATQSEVRGLVVRQGMTLVAGGAAIGLGAALGLSRVLRALLYDVSPADPLTYLGVALLLGGVALLASFIPAARATRIQPIAVLRNE